MTEITDPQPLPLVNWRAGGFPHDVGSLLGSSGPLHFEVGFGDGRYTARRALAHPSERFVAAELSGVSVLRALKRMRRENVPNVALLKGEAHFLLRNFFGPESLSSITVNFPDPWPKGRHEENRLLKREFFELAAARLLPGGSVLLATDHEGYLEFAREQGALSGLYDQPDAEPPPAVFETKYALKWLGQGLPLYYQPFVRNHAPAAEQPILERPEEMPHAILRGNMPRPESFEKIVLPYEGGHVIVHEAAYSAGEGGRWLFRVTVDEPELRQQLLLVLQDRSDGEMIVRLESFGDPIVTKVVRGAVHAVTEWALQQPGLELKSRFY